MLVLTLTFSHGQNRQKNVAIFHSFSVRFAHTKQQKVSLPNTEWLRRMPTRHNKTVQLVVPGVHWCFRQWAPFFLFCLPLTFSRFTFVVLDVHKSRAGGHPSPREERWPDILPDADSLHYSLRAMVLSVVTSASTNLNL